MAPIPRATLPRVVVYYQTTHDPDGKHISILPLIMQPDVAITHLVVAAVHINEDPSAITLNDRPPTDSRFVSVWAELRVLQASGVKVLAMLGGAAKGSYTRLDHDETEFEAYYGPVRDLIKQRGLDGLDLDVEERMSLAGIVRLIDRLRSDFGPDFIITLAPVAAALLNVRHNLSGFDYEALEVMRGEDISWYNAQFYCGWGDARNSMMYEMCVARGWPPEKVVMGLVTTPENGSGWVSWEVLGPNLTMLKRRFEKFGGVMGWEYFNSSPGGIERPWEWAQRISRLLRGNEKTEASKAVGNGGAVQSDITGNGASRGEVLPDATDEGRLHNPGASDILVNADLDSETSTNAPLPSPFEYHSDGSLSDS
jgi:hypothetical protein